jgi:hypothetical protein
MTEDLMRNHKLWPIVVALTLTACGGDDDRTAASAAGGATGEGASGAAANGSAGDASGASGAANSASNAMPQLRPGNYAVQVSITRFEVPGLPPEVAAQMQQAMAGVGQQVQNQCITPEQSRRSMEDVYKQVGTGNCTIERMSMTGGQISGAMRCDAGGGRVQAMTIEGTITEEGSTTNMSMVANDPNLPNGQIETDMSITMTRTGDCAS